MHTYVVTEACIRCKYTDCAEVCPVDCIHEGPNFVAIDPDECINCGVCVPVCPVKAIYSTKHLPPDQKHMIALNAELSQLPGWPVITERKPPPPDAKDWEGRSGKLSELIR